MADEPTNGTGGDNSPPWYQPAESLKTTDPEIWQSFEKSVQSGGHKDMAGLVKHTINLEKKIGSTLTMPAKDKPEEIKAFKERLVKDGILSSPPVLPESPDKYEIKLDAIPEPLRSESTIKAVTTWAHKNGVTNDQLNELVQIEAQRYEEIIKPVIEMDRQKSQEEFDVWAKAQGKDAQSLQAYGGAWLTKNVNEQELAALERMGLADHPALLKLVAKAGMDTGEDISIIDGSAGGATDAEYDDVIKMTSDPTHPDHKMWLNGDPQNPKRIQLQQRYEAAMRRKHGTGEIA